MGFLQPVGPEPPSTYWVRRVLVLIALLLVVALLWWLFVGRSSGSPAASDNPTNTSTPTPSLSVTSTPPTSASHTNSPTGTSSSSTGTPPECTNADIKVVVTTNAQSYPPAQDPTFTLSVTNTSSAICVRDVGSAAEELTVTSGQTRVWSSDDCNPPGTSSVSQLRPGQPVSVSVQWGRTFSQPGCPTGQPDANAGTYQVVGRVGSKHSAPATFSLT